MQVNGKLRGRIKVPKDAPKDALEELARKAAAADLSGKSVRRAVVVPGRGG